ncbi:BatD family protein [Neomegalonema perideroedes]|uniref:BatD family protein n=1 Tax=Neomegalonema perideroedes TaxID=217219 RepID=UPI00037BD959|nr:BatD family protein [Neomegalonema perideroedes]
MVIRLFRFLALALLVFAAPTRAQEHEIPPSALREAFIELALPSDAIYQGEAVILQIQYVGPEKESLDLSPLEKIGAFGRETFGTRLRVINGEVVELHTHRIEITPYEAGPAVFGPLEYGGIVSNRLAVEILPPSRAAWRPTDQDIGFTQKLSNPNPWVQQQMILDLELAYRYPLSDEKLELPDFSGFRVAPVFVQQRAQGRDAAGNPRATISWRYLLYPQRSGPQVLGGARFTGIVAKSRVERAIVDLIGAETALAVKRAEFAPSQWWLVAEGLTISEEWVGGDPAAFSAGEEMERQIRVTARDALAEQIPDVEMPRVPGLEVTRIGHKRINRIGEEGSEATAIFRYRLRALRPGPVVLETIRLRWWDGDAGRAGEAVLPPRRLEIGEAKIAAAREAMDPGLAAGAWSRTGLLGGLSLKAQAGIGAGLLAALGALLWPILRRRRALAGPPDLRARLNALRAALRRRDSAALHEALRALSRDPQAGAGAGALRAAFEESAHRGEPPDWPRLRAEAGALVRALKARARAAEPGLLPPL